MKIDAVSTSEREALTRALVESDSCRLAYEDAVAVLHDFYHGVPPV